MQFLMGLDDVYQPIKSSLLTRDPIPDVKTAFSIISREESHRGSSSSSSGNKAQAFVFVAKVHNNNNNFKKNLSTKNPNLANNGNNNNQSSVSSNNSSTNTAEVPTYAAPSLTTDQIEQLINMLNSKPQSNIHVNMAEYTVNLLSVHKLARDSKLFIGFDEFKCYIQDLHRKKTLGIGSQHRGHPSDQILKALRDRIDIRGNGDSALCDICHEAKYTREPFIICDHKTTNLGDIFHLDVWGPYRITSREGYKYFLTVMDDYSRAVWLYLLKGKDEVTSNVIDFYNRRAHN
ncbi:ribonuclease H-like domain-containing protein [Tanacetum coccineum]